MPLWWLSDGVETLSVVTSVPVFARPFEVKPPNVLVDRSMEEVKLADFGVSKILEASGHAGAGRVISFDYI